MANPGPEPSRHADLVRIIRRVRRRWRLKAALRGGAVVLAVGLVTLLLAAWGLERLGAGPSAVLAFRAGTYLALLAAAYWFLLRPLLRRASDERVALYLEEHEPSLDAILVSALEAGRGEGGAAGGAAPSRALVRELVERAVERCHELDDGLRVDRRGLREASLLLGGAAVLGAGLLLFGPESLRQGAAAIYLPWRNAEAAAPLVLEVEPGNVVVARGAEQLITARVRGGARAFGSGEREVALLVRTAGESGFERYTMPAGRESGTYELLLFELTEQTEYFVEVDGVRSPVYRIDVADLPYVERLDLEYRYPAYTGLPPERVEDGGDIAALRGTEVRIQVTPTRGVPGGRIVVEGGEPIELTPQPDGTLVGTLRVGRDGFYRIELQGPDGKFAVASPQYVIDALEDGGPTVRFSKPGRDTRASPIDEVFVEVRADDDYGIQRLELVYTVNGGPEQVVELVGPGGDAPREVTAGHTFFLEELDLRPGDFVAYHARVTDNDRIGGPKQATSDIYFLQIRPFSREYRQAEQRGGMQGGGGMGGGEAEGGFSERQRQIIAATFNLVRDRALYTEQQYAEHLVTIRLAEERLRGEVETLVRRMRARGVVQFDSVFQRILELLPQAVGEMRAAEGMLAGGRPQEALPPEQRALQHLQRAEEVYREVQVSFGEPGGGGGGGGSSAEDLADLFELEVDRLKNQYETVQRGGAQGLQSELDETLERLRELARRQEQQMERQRRQAQARAGAPGAGDEQRQLAEEVEQEARRLERLARENRAPGLLDAARRLQQVAEEMRRSAAERGGAGAAGSREALERLEEVRRQLAREREQRAAGEANGGGERQQDRTLDRARDLVRGMESLDRRMREREEGRRRLGPGRSQQMAGLDGQQGQERQQGQEGQQGQQGQQGARQEQQGQRGGQAGQSAQADEQAAAQGGAGRRGTQQPPRDGSRNGQQAGTPEAGQPGQMAGGGLEGERTGEWEDGAPIGGRQTQIGGPGGGNRRLVPGAFTGEEIRQFRGEIRERLREARELRGELARQGYDVGDLDRVLAAMRALDNDRVYADAEEVARLRTQVLEGLRRFEYSLRRAAERPDSERLFLSGTPEVPPEYRELVEEYYKSLSTGRQTR